MHFNEQKQTLLTVIKYYFLFCQGIVNAVVQSLVAGMHSDIKCTVINFYVGFKQVKGGRGTGGSQSSASCSLFSNCPYFFVSFSADSHPLLRFSHYDVNDGIFTPYCNRECFGLVQKKNSVVNQTTLHSPPSLLKRHSFDTSFHSVFNCELQSYGASSQEDLPWMDFSPSY